MTFQYFVLLFVYILWRALCRFTISWASDKFSQHNQKSPNLRGRRVYLCTTDLKQAFKKMTKITLHLLRRNIPTNWGTCPTYPHISVYDKSTLHTSTHEMSRNCTIFSCVSLIGCFFAEVANHFSRQVLSLCFVKSVNSLSQFQEQYSDGYC